MSDAAVKVYVYHGAQRMGLVRGITSLQWMPEWADVGEIKMVCALSDANRRLLQQWATLYNPDTPGIAAIVTAARRDSFLYFTGVGMSPVRISGASW